MNTLTQQSTAGTPPIRNWWHRLFAAGFFFFLAKGLVWLAAAAWLLQ